MGRMTPEVGMVPCWWISVPRSELASMVPFLAALSSKRVPSKKCATGGEAKTSSRDSKISFVAGPSCGLCTIGTDVPGRDSLGR